MATLGECKVNIETALGREMTREERGAVSRRVGDLLKALDKTDSSPGAISQVLQQFKDEKAARLAYNQRATALDWRAFSDLKAYRQVVGPQLKHPGELFKAVMRGSMRNFQGAKDSLANLIDRESSYRWSMFDLDLMQNKDYDIAYSGTLDDKITGAQWDIRRGMNPDPNKYGAQAIRIAQTFEKHTEKMRQDMNAEGAWIPKNDDRLFPRRHDTNRIARAGDNDYGSDAAKKEWGKFVDARMDWEKAFNGDLMKADPAVKQQRLDSLWTQFTADSHLKFSPDLFGPGARFGLSAHRELVFKDPSMDLEYQQTYGRGQSVAETIHDNLAWNGKQLAMLKKLGVRGERTLKRFYDDWAQELNDAGDHDGLRKLTDSYQDEMKNTWRLLTESAGHPNDNFVGRMMSSIRMTTNNMATGMSIFALPGDLALKAGRLWQADRGNYFGNLLKSTVDQFTPKGLSKTQLLEYYAQMGVKLEMATRPMNDNMVDHAAFGAVTKFNNMIARAKLHAPWDNSMRVGSYNSDAMYYHNLKAKSAYDMSPGEAGTLAKFNVTHAEWEVIRQSQSSTLYNGSKGLQPSDIRDMDLEPFKALSAGNNPSDVTLKRIRDRVADSYRNLLGENANRVVTSPSTARNAMLKMGTSVYDPNTIHGWAALQALQLKGWAINYMSEHLGTSLLDQYTSYKSIGGALSDMMMGKNNRGLQGIAQLVAGGVGIAYTTNALKDLAKGKSPIDPTGHKDGAPIGEQPWFNAAMDAFARGSFGLYSDFLLSKGNPDEGLMDKIGKIATGPEGEFIANTYDLVSRDIKQGFNGGYTQARINKDLQQAFGFAYKNVPATNVFWMKWALDYYILNNISEQINPGYQQRLKDYAKKNDQYYLAGSPGLR